MLGIEGDLESESVVGPSLSSEYSHQLSNSSYSQALLREAKRILERQRRENPLLQKAFEMRQEKQR